METWILALGAFILLCIVVPFSSTEKKAPSTEAEDALTARQHELLQTRSLYFQQDPETVMPQPVSGTGEHAPAVKV